MALRPGALLLLAALGAALSGCSGPATAADPGTQGGDAPAPAPDALPLPPWEVGDWWTYTVDGQPSTYVVTSETATDWVVDTDSEERAFADARDDISRLGPQRKSDLAGSQGEQRVEFFRWPLADNATWATRWDGRDVAITARLMDGKARLEARDANGTLAYRYTYDPAVRWFGELRAYDAEEDEVVALVLSGSGKAWKGTAVRWQVHPLHEADGGQGGGDARLLQPPAGTTDLWLAYTLSCSTGNGGYTIALRPALAGAAEGHLGSGRCQGDVAFEGVVPGAMDTPWVLAYSWGADSMAYRLEALARTRVEVPVG